LQFAEHLWPSALLLWDSWRHQTPGRWGWKKGPGLPLICSLFIGALEAEKPQNWRRLVGGSTRPGKRLQFAIEAMAI